jgi:YegS/Rv2252/BmrU family lipid kinase
VTRAFVIVNPAAGGGRTRRLWPALRPRLGDAGLDFEAVETGSRGAATDLARGAVRAGWPMVVAIGGDGTVNEVVNGLMDPTGHAGATLGIVPTGRGCDTCRNLRLPTVPDAAVRSLAEGVDTVADLGVAQAEGAHRRYFVNAAGAGFDAVVARRAQATGGRGPAPYLLGVLGALRDHRPVPTIIRLDGARIWQGRMTMAVTANGSQYGGGMTIAPRADPTDGALDLTIVGDLGRLALLRWLPTLLRSGPLGNPKVVAYRGRSIVVEASSAIPVHVDGERLGQTPVRLAICPSALRLRRP